MLMVNYIFLSREIPLPLPALKLIKNTSSFNETCNLTEKQFKAFLLSLKSTYKISLRNIDKMASNFGEKNNPSTYSQIEKELKICKDNDIKCLSYFDKDFPPLIKRVSLTPKLIFIKGEILQEDEKAVAIIGTRNPTAYGKRMAILVAKRFSELGFTIVSGFARGIDTIAMRSALDNGGRVIGVIASGILNLYPKENQNLVNKLVENGALISERFPNKSVTKRALQIRNRITSGLGLGNVFVEGNKFSGTKWQFKYGNEQGRSAIAVEPIDHESEQSYIPRWIIEEKGGARISSVEDVDVIAETLMEEYKQRKKKANKKFQQRQVNLLKFK